MLEFIFDYTWVAMLMIIYVIWSITSIMDIIRTKRSFKETFDIMFLDEGTLFWIAITLLGIGGASFLHWFLGGEIG